MTPTRFPVLFISAGRILLIVLAIIIGLYPASYFVWDRFGFLASKSPVLLNNLLWNVAFYIHIIAGGLALLIGWVQFSRKIRQKKLQLHRNIGKLYVLLVLGSATAGVYLGFMPMGVLQRPWVLSAWG